jgi:hypothetical protein
MKKIGILLAILLVAGVCAMADEAVAMQGDALFADVDAVALSQAEMQAVDGGQFPGDCSSGNEWKTAKRERTKQAVKDIVKGGAKGVVEAVKFIRGGAIDWVVDKADKALDRW